MKNLSFRMAALLLIISTSFIYCSPSRDYVSTSKEIMSQGEWLVTWFYAGHDKTSQYSGYQFRFLSNGTMTATNGNQVTTGSWNMIRDVHYQERILINITGVEPAINELNGNWLVRNKTMNSVEMGNEVQAELKISRL